VSALLLFFPWTKPDFVKEHPRSFSTEMIVITVPVDLPLLGPAEAVVTEDTQWV
jgi:hypothetical protein